MTSRPTETFPDLASRTAWLVSDGRDGNDALSRGILDALRVPYDVKRISPSGIWRLMAPYGPVAPSERVGANGSAFAPPWPDFVIGAGRQVTPYLRAIRRRAGLSAYTIQLLDPRAGLRAADLYWVPSHDRLRGPNVISSLTSPHSFSPERLAAVRSDPPDWLERIARPRIAVLIGGPSKVYRYDEPTVKRLLGTLQSLIALGAGLMITPSRRTPAVLVDLIGEVTAEGPHHVWTGVGDNPLRHYLAQADVVLVTADSTNMVGEACVTGKPVYVFKPTGGSAKIQRFHSALEEYGATRTCPEVFERIETWGYTPLYSAQGIAEAIAERWRRRRGMLSGLVR